MLKKLFGVWLVFFLAAISSAAIAQDMPPGKWWRDSRVIEELNLTEAQVTQLDLTYQNRFRELLKQKNNVEQERFELENLIDDKSMDEAAVQAQYKKLEKAQESLGAERFNFILEVRKIIGNDKFCRLKSMYSRSHKNRPDYGPDRRDRGDRGDRGMLNK
jgi:Spy/CpxP family protein refolding chaperone